jgi:hypothetical protein
MGISSRFSNGRHTRGRSSLIVVLGALAALALLVFARPAPAQTPTTLTLMPPTATNPLGTEHTVTATARDETGQPMSGAVVFFTVVRQDEQIDGVCVTGHGDGARCDRAAGGGRDRALPRDGLRDDDRQLRDGWGGPLQLQLPGAAAARQ